MCRQNRFIMICKCVQSCNFYPKPSSRIWFYAYKKYKNVNSASVQLNNVISSCPAEVTISVKEYLENYQKHNFKYHFLEKS